MKRFFYTDPLAAAWQAKHFGTKFGIEHNGKVVWDCIGTLGGPWGPLTDPSDILDPISEHDCLYVHPDSLPLLSPQVNDYVEYYNCFLGTIWKRENGLFLLQETSLNNPPEEVSHYTPMERVEAKFIDRIIQRNGIPFMWPESEEASA